MQRESICSTFFPHKDVYELKYVFNVELHYTRKRPYYISQNCIKQFYNIGLHLHHISPQNCAVFYINCLCDAKSIQAHSYRAMHLLLYLVLHERDLNSSVKQEQNVWAWFDTHEEHQRDFKEFTPQKSPIRTEHYSCNRAPWSKDSFTGRSLYSRFPWGCSL